MDAKTPRRLSLRYDVANDVLCCSFGKPREAITREVADGILVRLDPDDETHVVGFTVLDLRRRSLRSRAFDVPLGAALA